MTIQFLDKAVNKWQTHDCSVPPAVLGEEVSFADGYGEYDVLISTVDMFMFEVQR